jgi:hypothetical protein
VGSPNWIRCAGERGDLRWGRHDPSNLTPDGAHGPAWC